MQPSRTFSFEADDGAHNSTDDQHPHQLYHDSPSRDIISPPPHYASPLPVDPPSPVSTTHSQHYHATSRHDARIMVDRPGDYLPEHYTDQSPSPPPPPPHRTSPSRYTIQSLVRRSPDDGTMALDDLSAYPHDEPSNQAAQVPRESDYSQDGTHRRSIAQPQDYSVPFPGPHLQRPSSRLPERSSYASNIPLAAGAVTPGSVTPGGLSSRYSGRSVPLEEHSSHSYNMALYGHSDSPYHRSSTYFDPALSDASINPEVIIDDGDDAFLSSPRTRPGTEPGQQNNLGKSGAAVTVDPTVGSVRGGGALRGLFGRKSKHQTSSGTYGPVQGAAEKSAWLAREKRGRKRMGLIVGIVIGLIIVIAVVAGIVGGVLGTRASKSSSGNTNNANDDTTQNGDLDLNSAEIKALLNNPNLHKVFPGIDYTPWGVQYPLCETYPPSQNNVTRDMAVLSQLTNTVRLYGTDCNQTEMVLHSIDRLKLENVKIWLGVWIDTNQTTTNRQLAQMYKILSNVQDKSIFKGAIIGNEALYRAGEDKAQSKQELIQILTDVKSNFTSLGYDLPVATSDLGDNWDASLVAVVDYVMSNIHPFFAGVSAETAASWTYSFWANHDLTLTASTPDKKQIISETGWPSDGGTDCGGETGDCATGQAGATASVANMNTFMENWVCQAMANGTDYFWFEAFDEPWKIQYNTPGKEWEDKWGLMDSARNLKSGVKIPDCGGKTVS